MPSRPGPPTTNTRRSRHRTLGTHTHAHTHTHTHTHTSRRPSTSIQLDLHTTHTGCWLALLRAPQQGTRSKTRPLDNATARRGPSALGLDNATATASKKQEARRSSSTTPPASQDVPSGDATRNKIDETGETRQISTAVDFSTTCRFHHYPRISTWLFSSLS
jgi:hypothetical protein